MQSNRTENPEHRQCLIKTPKQHNGEKTVFSTNGALRNGHPYEKKHIGPRFLLYTIHKILSKTKYRPKTCRKIKPGKCLHTHR